MGRKRIALFTINPENEIVSGVMNGVFAQSAEYGYDVVVITPMVHSSHFFKDYLEGELRIYDIVNFDLFDGVLITPVPMQEELNTEITDKLLEKFERECRVPVVSIDMEFGSYDVVFGNDRRGMESITSHVIKNHGCKNIIVLTGPRGLKVSGERVEGVKSALQFEGLELPDDRVVYGDFWYTSGEKLGKDIVEGRYERPDAIVCTSDHMAIGVINELTANGIRVPEDIIVTGFGGTMDAAVSFPSVTTCEYDEAQLGAEAVNRLSRLIDSECELLPVKIAGEENICHGASCGCKENTLKLRKKLQEFMDTTALMKSHKETAIIQRNSSMMALLDSYISESFTSVENVDECLKKIYESFYLIKPYSCMYICLNSDWLDVEPNRKGYTESMNMVIYSDMDKKLHGYPNHVFYGKNGNKSFPTTEMLPVFNYELAKMIPGLEVPEDGGDIFPTPQVYYFTPLHIGDVSIGYAVLQNSIDSKVRLSAVYRNYIRYLNNALEMSRAKDIIINISEHDQLTGLFNRRGMIRSYEEMRQDILDEVAENELKEYSVLAMMIDMNDLKLINDTEGHDAGDQGIKAIANAARKTAKGREFAVRGGGDEFYLIGMGKYTDEDGEELIKEFKSNLRRENRSLGQTANYSAAVGYAIMSFDECEDYHTVLDEADVRMYVDKRMSKRARR